MNSSTLSKDLSAMECDVTPGQSAPETNNENNNIITTENYGALQVSTSQYYIHRQHNHIQSTYDAGPPELQIEQQDPLALDETPNSVIHFDCPSKLVKHTHSLRRHVPRIIVKPIPDSNPPTATIADKDEKCAKTSPQASTMREVLASIPGFSMKPRRRSNKKMSTAAQIEQTKDGKIDLETPDSILVGTNLRA